jgi:hypothetical protein
MEKSIFLENAEEIEPGAILPRDGAREKEICD